MKTGFWCAECVSAKRYKPDPWDTTPVVLEEGVLQKEPLNNLNMLPTSISIVDIPQLGHLKQGCKSTGRETVQRLRNSTYEYLLLRGRAIVHLWNHPPSSQILCRMCCLSVKSVETLVDSQNLPNPYGPSISQPSWASMVSSTT